MADIFKEINNEEANRRIHLLELGPNGSIFVAHIGNHLLIKVLNMQDDISSLLPYYFDFDYDKKCPVKLVKESFGFVKRRR